MFRRITTPLAHHHLRSPCFGCASTYRFNSASIRTFSLFEIALLWLRFDVPLQLREYSHVLLMKRPCDQWCRHLQKTGYSDREIERADDVVARPSGSNVYRIWTS